MKHKIIFLILILLIPFVCTRAVDDSIHLNVQSLDGGGNVEAGTFIFAFNISTTDDCANVVYGNYSTLTTDSNGIISHYLNNTQLNYSEQYWLCIYKDGILQSTEKIAQSPYAFRARNVTLSGVEVDSNLDLTNKNITTTGTGFFSWLGSLVSRITSLFVQNIDFTGNINGSGNINTTANVTAHTFFGNWNGSSLYALNTTAGIQYLINSTNMKFGDVDFNTGWQSGGVSIVGGNLFAQTGYFYNISSLNVNNLNMNGSIFPAFDNQFNLGNSTFRWKDIYASGDIRVNGTLYYGNEGISITALNDTSYTNSRIIAVNSTDLALTINTTRNIQNLYNNSVVQTLGLYLGNANESYLTTYNATYESFKTNVSRNWTLDTYNNWNTVWSAGGFSATDFHAAFVLNATLINTTRNIQNLYNASIPQWFGLYLGNANASYLTTYNATYDSFAKNTTVNIERLMNVSIGMTANFSINQMQLGANTSYLTTYNATYDSFISNVSRNWTLDVWNNWNSLFGGSGIGSTNVAWLNQSNNFVGQQNITGILNVSSTIYVEGTTNISTWKTNISRNWTLDVWNNWNSLWGASGFSATDFHAAFVLNSTILNTTRNIQNLYNATAIMFVNVVNDSALHIGEQNKTKLHCSNITGAVADLCTVTGSGGDFSFTDFHAAFVLNSTILNTTRNIQNLYNNSVVQFMGLYLGNANESYLTTYNATYEGYKTNVSRNWTLDVWNNWNSLWGASGFSAADFQAAFVLNTTLINTTRNIQNLYNASIPQWFGLYLGNANESYLTTYNATYEGYKTNVSRNWTLDTYNNWNTIWSAGGFSATDFHAAFVLNATMINTTRNIQNLYNNSVVQTLGLYLGNANESYLTTFNATYEGFKTNVSRNWTLDVWNNWNSLFGGSANYGNLVWTNQSNNFTGQQNITGILNVSSTIYVEGTTNISTWKTNISRNWTLDVWNNWNSLWGASGFSATDFQAAFVLNSTLINTTYNIQNLYNASIPQWFGLYLGNANESYLTTFNATYDSFISNVSRNWTLDTYNNWNTVWSAGGFSATDFHAAFVLNATLINTTRNIQNLYNASIPQWFGLYLGNANASYLTTYNATYDSFAKNTTVNIERLMNVSIGMTANFSINQMQLGANTSYLTTYNVTYHSFTANVSRNWTLDVYNNWNSLWGASGFSAADFHAAFVLNATLINTTRNIQNLYNASIPQWFGLYLGNANESYLTTFNATYDSFVSNVSRNWTLDVWNNWNSLWGGSSFSAGDFQAAFVLNTTLINTTRNIQNLYNNSVVQFMGLYLGNANASYLTTYNATYETFAKNTTANFQRLLNNTNMYLAQLGIGTETPTHELNVVGNTNFSGNFTIGSGAYSSFSSNVTCTIIKGKVSTLEIC